jgi:TolB protein
VKGYSKSFLVWLLVAGFLLSGCGQTNSQSGCKKIAFVMSNKTNSDIYTVCPNGSNLTNLTNDKSSDSSPSWSPDGSKIAFTSLRTGNAQIYIMAENGSNPIKVTSDYENDLPIWLPDGKQIAFRTTDGKGLWWWRIANLESKEIAQFSEQSFDFFFQTPAWSPDGKNIAYMSLVEQQQRNDGSSQIHVKSIDGSVDTALTNNIWANINPIWSPDGKRIAFLSERDGKYNMFALYVMDKNGTNLQKLTEPIYPENVTLSWSPNGQQIAINNDVPVGNISIIDIKTGESRELLHLSDGESAFAPSWQP